MGLELLRAEDIAKTALAGVEEVRGQIMELKTAVTPSTSAAETPAMSENGDSELPAADVQRREWKERTGSESFPGERARKAPTMIQL